MEVEVIIIIVLAVVVISLVVDRLRGRDRLREQTEALSRVVGEKVGGSLSVFGEVRERLGELTKRTQDIEEVGKNISSLQELLRAPKFRGGFGELLLERLLADVLPRDTYSLQYRFSSGDTVDAVIKIGGRLVPIDSKFPLEDFGRILEAGTEAEQKALRRQFVRTVKNHVANVAKYVLPDEGTFDFALMYIPAENIYYETILRGCAEESEICAYSIQKRVIPVSPNSFYAYLQVIVQGLRGLHIEQTAREILGYLQRLQGDLADFQDDYRVVGTHIRNAAGKYDEASRKLTRFGDKLELASRTPAEKLPGTDAEGHHPEADGR
jgi:DNA recombination protein RmuC